MYLKKELSIYKRITQIEPKEEKIQETIRKSKEIFYTIEQEKTLSYHEFLWEQSKLIQKRWWILQFLLLCILGIMLGSPYEDSHIQKSMGIISSMFVILIIPELWKNRSYHCMEIEESSYYSLRQIYAARMVLFGIVDILFLTVFCGTMATGMRIEFTKLLVQFLLPMIVTVCICFGTLCSKYITNETVAIFLCILWSAIWLLITLNEKIYTMITPPIWMAYAGFSLIFMCIMIYRTLNSCNNYWEVGFDDIRTE